MFEVEIDAPWTNGPTIYKGMLGFIAQTREQLLYFQKQNDTEYIRRDIAGYDEVLKSNSEDNASKFLELKHDAKMSGNPYKDNMVIVEKMKHDNLWKVIKEK